jgi:hypothetical protein
MEYEALVSNGGLRWRYTLAGWITWLPHQWFSAAIHMPWNWCDSTALVSSYRSWKGDFMRYALVILVVGSSFVHATESHCHLIQSDDKKNHCLGIVMNKESFCYSIKESDTKNMCVAQVKNQSRYCYRISSTDAKNFCLAITKWSCWIFDQRNVWLLFYKLESIKILKGGVEFLLFNTSRATQFEYPKMDIVTPSS